VIPYFADGEFKLFYLHIWRVPEPLRGERGWYLLGTQDFVHFHEHGPCHIPGGTGSVLQADGRYHMFYCIFPDGRQIICHATSTDLVHWDTHPGEDFGPDTKLYESSDWRDPHVIWNADEGLYWMLIAARAKSRIDRNGCVGLCVSSDLKTWQPRPPLLAPNLNMSALE
jgi:beta-fructofuranosidase